MQIGQGVDIQIGIVDMVMVIFIVIVVCEVLLYFWWMIVLVVGCDCFVDCVCFQCQLCCQLIGGYLCIGIGKGQLVCVCSDQCVCIVMLCQVDIVYLQWQYCYWMVVCDLFGVVVVIVEYYYDIYCFILQLRMCSCFVYCLQVGVQVGFFVVCWDDDVDYVWFFGKWWVQCGLDFVLEVDEDVFIFVVGLVFQLCVCIDELMYGLCGQQVVIEIFFLVVGQQVFVW